MAESKLAAALREAHNAGRAETSNGKVASYIPELAKADPSAFGLAAHTIAGEAVEAGEADAPFTLQSVSKVFALALALREHGTSVFDWVSFEPSGDAFHSIVRLEEERGHPRNPYINAGAIVVSELLPGATPDERIYALQSFLAEAGGETCPVDDAVYRSEAATGFRNRALANYMRHHGWIGDPETAIETYFRQCSLTVSARSLARMGLFLANRGVDPETRRPVVDPEAGRTVVALMATCGLYDEVGRFALNVGLPAKAGVSGAILAVVPGRMALAAYGPALGPKGNSIAGMKALEVLSDRLGLSLYG